MLFTRMEEWQKQWKQQLEQQWLLEAEQRGEQKGEAALLLRQLQRRFGDLPGWARDRVLSADTVTMEQWSLRVLDAASLEEVLA